MTERKFTVIKGGKDPSAASEDRLFISAYVTDTRLMGVLGMYVHYDLDGGDLHQFYYFDAEEFGFETYRSIHGSDIGEILLAERTVIGGLGGEKVELSEGEAGALLLEYREMNRRLCIPMPEGEEEYRRLYAAGETLTEEERQRLFAKTCTEITTDYQLVNYFLMRCVGRDYRAAAWLAQEGVELRLFEDVRDGVLCKNTIDSFEDAWLCESLIESGDIYLLTVSEIKTEDGRICFAEKHSSMKVSSAEAAMMLSRPEFVTIYEVMGEPEDVDDTLAELTGNSLVTVHENGKMFMAFHSNNAHVSRRIFRLNEDVEGLFYLTDYGQLLLAAYNLNEIMGMERRLLKTRLSGYLLPVSKYEFQEPILYEFMQSDFEDFEEFLDFIKDE